ncbi:MAG: hypothetical protein IJA98_05165 [Bacteroidaceae bacterium]|nr:hypothetical protein [Bacteroidaceae bacterium]
MAITILHPIMVRINNQSRMLECLISDFSYMQAQWNKVVEQQFGEMARVIADGDSGIEFSEFSQMRNWFEDSRDYKTYFYNSMLILVYSFYEDMVITIHNEESPDNFTEKMPKMSEFCQRKGIILPNNIINDVEFVYNDVRLLRNYITHCKWGRKENPPEDIKHIEKLIERYADIYSDNDSLYLTGTTFLLDVLKKEYGILIELTSKLGYISKISHS